MFGNKEHARLAAEFARQHVVLGWIGEYAPKATLVGFNYIGSGCNRHAFERDGFVYKINTSDVDGNAMEMRAYSILPSILRLAGITFHIAPVFQYVFDDITVNVQEYIDGEAFHFSPDEDDECADEFLDAYPELDYDIHPGNVIVKDGKNVIIDI